MLEKRYECVKFVIKNENWKNSSFTGTFTNQRLEKILEYFKVSSQNTLANISMMIRMEVTEKKRDNRNLLINL